MGDWCVDGTKINKSNEDIIDLGSEEKDENDGFIDFKDEYETIGKGNSLDSDKEVVCIDRGIQGNNL